MDIDEQGAPVLPEFHGTYVPAVVYTSLCMHRAPGRALGSAAAHGRGGQLATCFVGYAPAHCALAIVGRVPWAAARAVNCAAAPPCVPPLPLLCSLPTDVRVCIVQSLAWRRRRLLVVRCPASVLCMRPVLPTVRCCVPRRCAQQQCCLIQLGGPAVSHPAACAVLLPAVASHVLCLCLCPCAQACCASQGVRRYGCPAPLCAVHVLL